EEERRLVRKGARLDVSVADDLDPLGAVEDEELRVVPERVLVLAANAYDMDTRILLEPVESGQRREELAAILPELPPGPGQPDDRELAVVVSNPLGRPGERRRRARPVLRPLHVAGGGACGQQPVVAGVVAPAGLEPHLDPVLEREIPAVGAGNG